MKLPSFFLCLFFAFTAYAQNEVHSFPALSAFGKLSQQVGNTQIEIEYERPSARGRVIYGGLVPWGEVWRTGASYCTKISFSRPVTIGGQDVPAGKYSLFTIPSPKDCILILNTDTTLYGSYDYDANLDVARFSVKRHKPDRFYESLTIDLDVIPNNAKMYISWTDYQIHFPIETSTDPETMAFIKTQLLSGKSADSDLYANASDYFLFHNKNLYQGVELAQKAIELNSENGFARRVKVELYEKLLRFDLALLEAQKAYEACKIRNFESEEVRVIELKNWQNIQKRIEASLKK